MARRPDPAAPTLRAALGLLIVTAALFSAPVAMAMPDLSTLWDFDRPEASEAAFRSLLKDASPDEHAVLMTQIARSLGLRRRFDEARRLLAEVLPALSRLGPEPAVRYHLELGRTWVSATHRPEERTAPARAAARAAYLEAHARALRAGLDDLAVDALHMLPFVETDAALALRWNEQALALALGSRQPGARRWEASLRNNIGMSLHDLGRLDEALAMFEANIPVTASGGNARRLRIAHWMVAWTLRGLGRTDQALAIQLRLEAESAAAGMPDEYVFEELAQLYRDKGDAQQAAAYAARHAALRAATK